MYTALGLLLLTGFYPLWRAWRANRRTTLRHAVAWAAGAWAAWAAAAWMGPDDPLARYAALCLTGCAGVAVLGARRPGMAAWNFVVVALMAPLLLPIGEGLGELRPSVFEASFLSATLLVGLLNYLPTRLAAAVLPAGAAAAAEFALVLKGLDPAWNPCALALLAVAPWLGLAAARRRTRLSDEIAQEWMDFRDRFGAAWALRVRDQFNRASANAGWGVVLGWGGPLPADGAVLRAEALAGLRSVLRRFTTGEGPAA